MNNITSKVQWEVLGRVVLLLNLNTSLASLMYAFTCLSEIPDDERGYLLNKLMAEVCYLIGLKYKENCDLERAEKFAEMSIRLYERCNISSLKESVPILANLLPEHMHEGVVKSRLKVK